VAVLLGVGLIAAWLVLPLAAPAQREMAPFSGTLLYRRDGDLWQLNLATNEQRLFLRPDRGLVSHFAYSPDRQRLAYSVNVLDDNYRLVSSDILVGDADGRNARSVVHEEGNGVVVTSATWTADPNRLIYSRANRLEINGRVEEVNLTTGERSLVVADASSPSASPTAAALAYQTTVNRRWNIMGLDRAAGSQKRIVSEEWFDDADHPSYSPDGSTIAFVAAGAGPDNLSGGPSWTAWAAALGAPGTAAAHDLANALFDLWSALPDGSGMHRIAQLFDLQPDIAWSPDGRHIASFGTIDLQVVDVETGAVQSLPRLKGDGPIAWGN
jgi:tricorn protease-like protein